MWLIAGLGNPGAQYAFNRHNIGFMAVDAIADRFGIPSFKSKFSGQWSEARILNEKCAFLKPDTYMNKSGDSMAKAIRFYKIPLEQVIVFHDELDLAPGKIRIKVGGGAAGHNGLRSIDACLGNKNYKRVRMGIGHPGDKKLVHNYVLSNFAKADEDWIAPLIGNIAHYFEHLLQGEDSLFLSKIAENMPQKEKEEK